MDYKLHVCKCLHYGYCIFPSRSVFDLLVLPTNRWWTQADKKTLDLWRCDTVDPCVDYQFHLHASYIYNVRDINLAKIWNLVIVGTWNQYFAIFCKFEYCIHTHVLYPYLDIVIVKMSNSQSIIFLICMNSKYKRRKKEKYKC